MSASFTPKSDFLSVLMERGYIHQCSDFEGVDAKAKAGELIAYIGFDCTASSLHVGSLVQIMMLRWLQKTGGKPVPLMGGGTFGDAFTDAVMPDNAEWLTALNYIDFLRDVGRHFSVNRMLSMDSVKMRLERDQELSFIEFNYMCLQAYDFVELHRRYGCLLQMGGSDQWGNIVTGIDLGRRMGAPQLHALTSPLLTTASGAKMGKTAAGAIWLNADMLPVYDYWQYWRNTEDADVGRFLKLFTELPMDEIRKLEALAGAEINEAKKILATEATAMLHGRERAEAAAQTARQTFEEGSLATSLPTVEIAASELAAGVGVLNAFVKVGLVPSTGEARRQVKSGGLRVNDAPVTDERAQLSNADLMGEGVIKLSFGRKKHILLAPR